MSKSARILVCDDEYLIRLWLEEHLTDAGYEAAGVETGRDLLDACRENPPDIVLLDLKLPDRSGLEILPDLKELDPGLPVIMITAYGEVETAVAAVRAGAFHFLEKPVELEELLLLIEKALETRQVFAELDRYREGNRWSFSDVTLVGRSHAMRKVAELITRLGVKGSPANVLICGESGTGKDVVARAIHARGPRQEGPFISVNCTALPESLVESELFGHESGAFTDARGEKKGLLELAHGGTIFLDEIGDMPKGAQAKLLHFLESHAFRRVGGVRDREVDVHVITATNRDLDAAVEAGEFREDLFYRLNVIPVFLPPLRERPEDIAPLAMHFVHVLSRDLRLPARHLTPGAINAMEAYPWPGNARELRNVLERILLLEDVETISEAQLPFASVEAGAPDEGSFTLPVDGVDLDNVERELILQALRRTDGNKTAAARLLGISRDTLRYRLEKHEIEDGPAGPS